MHRYLLHLGDKACDLMGLIGILYAYAYGNDAVQLGIGVVVATVSILVGSLCTHAKDEALHEKDRMIVKEIVREIVDNNLVGRRRISCLATDPDVPAVHRTYGSNHHMPPRG